MDNLLNLLFKAVSVEPMYHQEFCLAAGRSVTCTTCADVCPHEAIRVGRQVEIDEVACSGCGLCVQACPSGALEAKVGYERGASVRCSRVKGSAQSVHCLGRLQASDLLRLVGNQPGVTLARGACEGCPIGGEAIASAVEAVRDEARGLASLHGRPMRIDVIQVDRLDAEPSREVLSRRELLRGGWRALQERAGDALAPLDPGEDEDDLPTEMQRRFRVIAAARPEHEDLVPWALPRVDDTCILCPICTNACPTDALERVFEPDGHGVLMLQPERCVGCGACAEACPVFAVDMAEPVTWGELGGGQREAYRRDPGAGVNGSISR